jgi:hypothetical protein
MKNNLVKRTTLSKSFEQYLKMNFKFIFQVLFKGLRQSFYEISNNFFFDSTNLLFTRYKPIETNLILSRK